MTDNIDLFPTIAALCSLSDGDSELRGIQRARIKESNRVTAMRNGLTKLGVPFQEFKEYVTIKGLNVVKKSDDDDTGTKETMMEKAVDFFNEEKEPPAIVIDSYNDHRIAMAFSIMGAALGGVTITNAECVKKTFPDFWKSFGAIGGDFKAYE
jgi:3-phosphoshikimate 1-carboxyvinyltransferase